MISDLRLALRQMMRKPGYAIVAALTLALGIGINASMFSFLYAHLLQTYQVRQPDRLLAVYRTTPQADTMALSLADYRDARDRNTVFQNLAAYVIGSSNLAEPGRPAERLHSLTVSGDLIPMFGLAPELGRPFTAAEARMGGSDQVALISDSFWRSHFGADPAVLGKSLRLDGKSTVVIGVMPPAFDNPIYWGWGRVDVWQPLNFVPDAWQIRDNYFVQAIGRLKDGVSFAQAQQQLSAIAARLGREHPLTNAQGGLRAARWNIVRVDPVARKMNWLLMGLSAFVLLIACANLANLQLARGAGQRPEHALRLALGATRGQIARLVLVESTLLAVVGAALGFYAAIWASRLMASEIVVEDVAGLQLPVDWHVLVFAMSAGIITGLAAGLYPAWSAGRTDVYAELKQGRRGVTDGRDRQRARKLLVVAEFIMALVLLSGAGFFIRGMRDLGRRDMGWTPDGLVVASLNLPYNQSYATDAQCRAFFDQLEQKMDLLPGERAHAISANLPITGLWLERKLAVEGTDAPKPGLEPLAYYNPVSPGYFTVLGIRLVRGRYFRPDDRQGSQPVAIVNEATAQKLWPGLDPIGRRLGTTDPQHPDWRVVVGVVKNVGQCIDFIQPTNTPFVVYRPLLQVPSDSVHYLNLAVRSAAPNSVVVDALRRAVASVDPDQPIDSVQTARAAMDSLMSGFTLIEQILTAFAVLGLLLAAIGLYGVVANSVAERTAELGIRMALGAGAGRVLGLVIRQAMILAGIGTLLGLGGAVMLNRLLGSLLPDMHGADFSTTLAIAAILAAVAFIAAWLPARRATRIDPIIALKT